MIFLKNLITKSIFLFTLSSFTGLSAMVEKTKLQSTEKTTASVQSVFGHRLRLTNFTNDRIFVEVEIRDGESWVAIMESFSSIDLGSIHDIFEKILVIKYQTNVLSDDFDYSRIEIPLDQIITFQSIPENHMLNCVVTGRNGQYNYRFEHTECQKNKLSAIHSTHSDIVNSHPAYRAFPSLKNDIMSILISGTIERFYESNPIKFYQHVLGLGDEFTAEDVIARSNRLIQEWNPELYTQDDDFDQIKTIQRYIKLAKNYLLHKRQFPTEAEASTSSMADSYTQTEFLATDMERLTLSRTDSPAPQPAPSTNQVAQLQNPFQLTVNASYFHHLLKRIRQGVSIYEEQKTPNPAHNTMLLDVFRVKQPIIPFEELLELINKCIQIFDDQTGIDVNKDNISYIQKQFIAPGGIVNITGDIHGSIHSLIRILDHALHNTKKNTNFVFLGDYTDRGLFGAEVLALLMCLKIVCWESVFMIRGNHESYAMNTHGGWYIQNNEAAFQKELEAKYGLIDGNKLLLRFNELYKRLPLAVYLGTNKDTLAQFCHGGLQPNFNPQEFFANSEKVCALQFRGDNFSSSVNGFTWGDFYLKNNQIIQDVSSRGDALGFIKNIPNIMSSNPSLQAPECTGVKAIFRGHQHTGCGLKMFPRDVDESLGTYVTELGLMPIPWYKVIETEQDRFEDSLVSEMVTNSDGTKYTEWKIRVCRFTPVYTFSTATEHGMVDDTFYGILHVAENFNDWMLQPVLIPVVK
ncbi:MAG: metallophosphoesterase family protein [bacterium]